MNAVTEIIPGPGHNSASFVEMIENDPGVVFREAEVLPALIKEIRNEIESAEIDLETDRGRKAIASRAAKIARRKTAIDAAGKDLNEEHRKAINAVDAVRREARNTLDELRDTARAPLDEWEAAEEARKASLAETIARLDSYGRHPDLTLEDVARQEADVSEIVITEDEFGGFYGRAVEAKEGAVAALASARTRIEKAEAERAELERLRAEQAKREAEETARQEAERQKERDQRIREEAAREAERKAQEEVERVKREAEEARKEAERKAAKAEEDRKAEEERQRAEEERRARDKALVAKACGAAKVAIMEAGSIDEETAKAIVNAIRKGDVPGVTLTI